MSKSKTICAKFILAGIVLSCLVSFSSCKTPTIIDSAYSRNSFNIECLGVHEDGSQTLRSWGKGKKKSMAMQMAKKNAVKAVIFDGIQQGTGECNKRPLVPEVNAREKYEDFFNRFFSDEGDYSRFVTQVDEKRTSRLKSADKTVENWGIVVRVDRSALKQYLSNRGIIKTE